MASRGVVPGLRQLPGPVSNAYLLDTGEGSVLIDTGMPGRGGEILGEIARMRRRRSTFAADEGRLAAIVLTHAHIDHAGSLAAIARAVDAPVLVGAQDAPLIREGGVPPTPSPTGPIGQLLAMVSPAFALKASRVDVEVGDGDPIPGAPGLQAIHTPGHTPGHLALLWSEHGGVLFAGDLAVDFLSVRESFVHMDRDLARESLARVAALDFEIAVFGHGQPIRGRAVAQFRRLVERLAR